MWEYSSLEDLVHSLPARESYYERLDKSTDQVSGIWRESADVWTQLAQESRDNPVPEIVEIVREYAKVGASRQRVNACFEYPEECTDESWRRMVKKFDEGQCELPRLANRITVFHGSRLRIPSFDESPFTLNKFLSTSWNPYTAIDFASGQGHPPQAMALREGRFVYQIVLEAGLQVVAIDCGEGELVVPRGSIWEISGPQVDIKCGGVIIHGTISPA